MPFPWPWTDARPLRFDRFMAAALHDPERGYYARRIRGVGRSGDFTTTPMISPALAKAVSAWAGGALRETGCRDLIELGPGEGVLAAAVRAGFPWHRRRWRLHLVEASRPLREKQLARLGTASRVLFHDTIEAALAACDGRACLYSNEFVDAFPVRRFRREATGWSELFLLPTEREEPLEEWQPLAAEQLPASSIFPLPHRPGQIVEVHESFHQSWRQWLPHWHAGRMLTLDYGAEADDLYHRQPRGSLRAYLLQQRLEPPAAYARPGRQDLTADVNFTDLATWPVAHARVLRTLDQRSFLLPHVRPGEPADAYAIDPAGAGTAFRLIEHQVQPQHQRLAPAAGSGILSA